MRVSEGTIWVAWGLIASFFLVALAATSVVPFGNTPISFATVTRDIGFSNILSQLVRPWHAVALAISALPVVVHTCTRSHRLRVWVPLLCLVGLLVWFTAPPILMAVTHVEIMSMLPGMLLKSFAQWFLAIPFSPYFTLSAVLGRQDGEFYEEGMMAYTAMGWWMILCLALLVRGWIGRRQHTNAA